MRGLRKRAAPIEPSSESQPPIGEWSIVVIGDHYSFLFYIAERRTEPTSISNDKQTDFSLHKVKTNGVHGREPDEDVRAGFSTA